MNCANKDHVSVPRIPVSLVSDVTLQSRSLADTLVATHLLPPHCAGRGAILPVRFGILPHRRTTVE